ncbi:hypothetical protein [Bacillus horti]|uniref:Uncharacterized protein n=2 Tax=Caldalkalibacillus horti TaxID=77523 RepID=A0ABT9W5Z1_9BACI|nr:hypothetical protein [Bacillus horti]MDQ0168497.1 hypothetical protein [Bacillus horti]
MKKLYSKKRYVLLSIIFIFIIAYTIFINWPKTISPPGSVLTEEMIERDLKILAGKDSFVSPIYFIKAEISLNDIVEEELIKQKSLHPEDQIIKLTIRSKDLFSIPYEVEYAMRVWHYLKVRQAPYPTEALLIYAYEGGLSGKYPILVTLDEYEELYQENINPEMDESEVVQILTQKWIEKNDYSRWGLE